MANSKIVINQPQGKIITCETSEGKMLARLVWNSGFRQKYTESFNKKQAFIDQECIRRMEPETPRLTGALIKSATLGTSIGSGEIHQVAPYARRQYYEHKEKSHWFERMKNRHKDSILRGAEKIG
ncbi:MAG: hypothetical protein ACI4S2_01445 [Lachnospiraceae bacterium]